MEGTAALRRISRNQRGWRSFKPGDWCTTIDVRDFIVSNVTPYPGDEKFLAGPSQAHQGGVGQAPALFPGGAEEGRARRRREDASTLLAHKAGYIDRDNEVIVGLQTDAAVQARHLSVRRPAHGRGRPEGGRLRGRSAGPRGFHEIPQDPQRRRVRRLHAGNHEVPQVRHHHRPSRRLRPRPHHRRLPARRALRRRPPDRGQAGGARADRRHVADRRGDPRSARNWPSRSAR